MEVLVIVLLKLFTIHSKAFQFLTVDMLFECFFQLLWIKSCFRLLNLLGICISLLVLLIDLSFNLICLLVIGDEWLDIDI